MNIINQTTKFLFLFFISASFYLVNAQTTITLQPDSIDGKDAHIGLIVPNNNYGAIEDIAPYAWTQQGSLNVSRDLIEFDLSSIPSNATISSASLSLYYNPTSVYNSGNGHSGSNAFWVKRITSSWDENTVTWNNQPTTTTTNQVSVAQSTSSTQNYLDIDVTNLVVDMLNNPTISHGFMLQLQDENPFKIVVLASSDNPDTTIHPKLVVTFTTVGIDGDYSKLNNNNVKIYPNPVNEITNVYFKNQPEKEYSLEIYNYLGASVIETSKTKSQNYKLNMDGLESGIYFIHVIQDNNIQAIKKVIVK